MPDRHEGFVDPAKSENQEQLEAKTSRGLSLLERLLPYFEPRLGSSLLSHARLSIRHGRVVPATSEKHD